MTMRRVTIKQVAQAAGVSTAAVSAVINGKENQSIFVGPEKRQRILDVVRELHYVPLKSARRLRSQKSDMIGVIFNTLNPYFASLLEKLQEDAYARGVEVLPYLTNGDVRREEEYLRAMADGRVDGVIICANSDSTCDRIRQFIAPPFNLKIVTTNPPEPGIASFHTDEHVAGQLVAEHFLSQGRRRLCYLGSALTAARGQSFLAYVESQGLEPRSVVGKRFVSDWPGVQHLVDMLLAERELPDGVFCSNDLFAVTLLGSAIDRGIRVPRDMAIVGYDNSPICLYPRPTLSSVDTGTEMIAHGIMDKIMNLIDKRQIQLHTAFKPQLVVRDSSAPAAASDSDQ